MDPVLSGCSKKTKAEVLTYKPFVLWVLYLSSCVHALRQEQFEQSTYTDLKCRWHFRTLINRADCVKWYWLKEILLLLNAEVEHS